MQVMEFEGRKLLELGKMKRPTSIIVSDGPVSSRRKASFCRTTCCGACCVVLVLIIVMALIILAWTLLKPKDPKIDVEHVTLDSFVFKLLLNIPPTLTMNATLGLVICIRNPNRVSLKYTDTTSHMLYRDVKVGSIPIPSGHVGSHGIERVSSSLALMADLLVSNAHIISDLGNGSLPFSTHTHISGRLDILNIYKHHFSALTTCNFTILTSNRSIADMVCANDLKL
ncbi:hypothetical protein L7F22_031206 [Adiantum nelumboides]|nr:hypothetical protein [Adiantum nelumboides]